MLQVFSLDQSAQWDRVVRTFHRYDTYWLSGYGKAFRLHGDGEPLLIYYEDDRTRGINVVMRRDIADDVHFRGRLSPGSDYDLASPYGYGGWLTEGDVSDALFSAYAGWCRQQGVVSEFVRFHPVVENQRSCEEQYQVVPLGNTVVLDLSSPERVWENLTVKNRNMIRKAQKNGIRIYQGRSPDLYEQFRSIYNATMDKDAADRYYYFEQSFYQSLCDDLPQNAQVFYAVYDGKMIAASVMLAANRRMNYHLSGSLREYANLAPTNLLLYEAALWGCANGCDTLYLGGGVGSGEDGLFRFKKSFYRQDDVKRFYIGKKIFCQERYDELLKLRGTAPERNFFPLYRA